MPNAPPTLPLVILYWTGDAGKSIEWKILIIVGTKASVCAVSRQQGALLSSDMANFPSSYLLIRKTLMTFQSQLSSSLNSIQLRNRLFRTKCIKAKETFPLPITSIATKLFVWVLNAFVCREWVLPREFYRIYFPQHFQIAVEVLRLSSAHARALKCN